MLKYMIKKYDHKKYNCWHLVVDYYKQELNIDLPNFVEVNGKTNYNILNTFIKEQSKNWIKLVKPKKNCVLIMTHNFPYANHIGIYLEDNKILHNLENTNVIISDYSLWKHKIVGAYEYKNF
jgi:cell wall-associated NlpC family hydrolase